MVVGSDCLFRNSRVLAPLLGWDCAGFMASSKGDISGVDSMNKRILNDYLSDFSDIIAEIMEAYLDDYEDREDAEARVVRQLHDFRARIAVTMQEVRKRMVENG